MNKIIFLILIITLVLFSSCSTETYVEDEETSTYSCPRGETTCLYPGKCYLYEDNNDNGECDHGEI